MSKYRKQDVCRCEAYTFPHRRDSGKCRELYNSGLENGYDIPKDSIDSLGLRNLFAPVPGIAGW